MEIFANSWFVIPARAGSKGLSNKNRILADYTFAQIPQDLCHRTIVSTNDEVLIEQAQQNTFNVIRRSAELSTDAVSMRAVLDDVVEKYHLDSNDVLVVLYLTYPERRYEHIQNAMEFFKRHQAKSQLCSSQPKTHPFMCLYHRGGFRGEQIVDHDLYQRQEYPECIEISHFIGIFKISEIRLLNRNLYNRDTIYYPIQQVIDVDTSGDLSKFLSGEVRERPINVSL